MWVKFPKGAENVTVQQQPFAAEAQCKDPDGTLRHFVRVPEHFLAHMLGLGFTAEAPAATDLDDLPAGGTALNSEELKALASEVTSLRDERTALQEEVKRVTAASASIQAERDGFEADYRKAMDELTALRQSGGTANDDIIAQNAALATENAQLKSDLTVAKENLAGIQQTLTERGIDLSAPPANGKQGK
jgi:septal ring factor EnvC (AmiA/AmiB activator)